MQCRHSILNGISIEATVGRPSPPPKVASKVTLLLLVERALEEQVPGDDTAVVQHAFWQRGPQDVECGGLFAPATEKPVVELVIPLQRRRPWLQGGVDVVETWRDEELRGGIDRGDLRNPPSVRRRPSGERGQDGRSDPSCRSARNLRTGRGLVGPAGILDSNLRPEPRSSGSRPRAHSRRRRSPSSGPPPRWSTRRWVRWERRWQMPPGPASRVRIPGPVAVTSTIGSDGPSDSACRGHATSLRQDRCRDG